MAAARSCMALLSLSASGAPATACHRLPAPAEAIAAKRFSSPSRCCLMPMRGSSRRLLQKYKEPGLNSLAASGLAPFWAGLAPFWAGPLLGWPPSGLAPFHPSPPLPRAASAGVFRASVEDNVACAAGRPVLYGDVRTACARVGLHGAIMGLPVSQQGPVLTDACDQAARGHPGPDGESAGALTPAWQGGPLTCVLQTLTAWQTNPYLQRPRNSLSPRPCRMATER
jgi:hypothetical protein